MKAGSTVGNGANVTESGAGEQSGIRTFGVTRRMLLGLVQLTLTYLILQVPLGPVALALVLIPLGRLQSFARPLPDRITQSLFLMTMPNPLMKT